MLICPSRSCFVTTICCKIGAESCAKCLGVVNSSIRGKQFLLYLGWTMVFKVVSNVSANGKSSPQMWSSSETINENTSEALNINSSFGGHYQNRFVPNWHLVKPKEVNLSFKIAHDKFSLSYRWLWKNFSLKFWYNTEHRSNVSLLVDPTPNSPNTHYEKCKAGSKENC